MPDFRNIDPTLRYTPAEAAALKGLSIQTIRYALRNGSLPAIREGNRYFVRGSTLLTWKRETRTYKPPDSPGREW